jgi:urea transporter
LRANLVNEIDTLQLFHGAVTGVGQIYFADKFISSILCLLAMLLHSPLLAGWSLFGSALGAIMALAFGAPLQVSV